MICPTLISGRTCFSPCALLRTDFSLSPTGNEDRASSIQLTRSLLLAGDTIRSPQPIAQICSAAMPPEARYLQSGDQLTDLFMARAGKECPSSPVVTSQIRIIPIWSMLASWEPLEEEESDILCSRAEVPQLANTFSYKARSNRWTSASISKVSRWA